MTATLITLLLIILATTRTTRAIVVDQITQPARQWVIRKTGPDSNWSFLIHCPWCTGFWIALPAALIAWFATNLGDTLPISGWFGVPILWFAIAHTTGWIMSKETN